jgi:hypothetical protein
MSRNVGAYRDVLERMRHLPAVVDVIDRDEHGGRAPRSEELCRLDVARQDQRSWV